MKFTWDPKKAASNLAKHGIRFDVAVNVFFDPDRVSYVDARCDYGEIREITIGTVENKRILLVVHTDRAGVTRLISARPVNKKERQIYENG